MQRSKNQLERGNTKCRSLKESKRRIDRTSVCTVIAKQKWLFNQSINQSINQSA